MKSFRVRMTLVFAGAAVIALAVMLAAGHRLLENRLVTGLDAMIGGHSDQIVTRIAFDADRIDQATLRRRIHDANEHLSDLIYINVTSRRSGNWVSYRSSKLLGQDIPVVEAWGAFTAVLPGIGAVRAQAARVGPFEVVVGTPLAPVARTMASYERIALLLLTAMVIFAAAIGFLLSHLALAPIRAIGTTAGRISSNDLGARIPVGSGNDELSALARLLNQMFDRLEAAFEQVRGFSTEASHELKTPLTLIRLHAERMLRDDGFPAQHAEAVVVQIEEIARLDRIIDELLFLSRADAGAVVLRASPQDPGPLLAAVSRDAEVLSEPRGCRYRFSHEGTGRAVIEESFIRQVLFNLLVNALDASPPASTVTLASRIRADRWQVSVEDEGPGLAPALRARMFDRFARFGAPGDAGKEADRGSGLGLAISRRMVELHGGRIYAADRDAGPGLRVVFELPAVPA